MTNKQRDKQTKRHKQRDTNKETNKQRDIQIKNKEHIFHKK